MELTYKEIDKLIKISHNIYNRYYEIRDNPKSQKYLFCSVLKHLAKEPLLWLILYTLHNEDYYYGNFHNGLWDYIVDKKLMKKYSFI